MEVDPPIEPPIIKEPNEEEDEDNLEVVRIFDFNSKLFLIFVFVLKFLVFVPSSLLTKGIILFLVNHCYFRRNISKTVFKY